MSNKVALVFKDLESANHWMVQRTFKRSGLELTDFTSLVLGPNLLVDLQSGPFTACVLFGEDVLYTVLGKSDILRWFNRVVRLDLQSKIIHCIPCLEPKLLLPYTLADDSPGRKKIGMRHPPRYRGVVGGCLRKAVKVASEGHVVMATDYLQDPTRVKLQYWTDEFYRSCDDNTILSWDIETPYKINEDDEEDYEEGKRAVDNTILRISFAYKEGHAVSVAWLPEHFDNIHRLLAFSGYHCGWNIVGFDIPVVESNGVKIGAKLVLDGMDAWHLYQSDLDKGLEHVTCYYTDILPWKHLSDTMPALYSCIDADAALRNVNGILKDLEGVNNG